MQKSHFHTHIKLAFWDSLMHVWKRFEVLFISVRSRLSIFEKILVLPQFPWVLSGFWGRVGRIEVVWVKIHIIGVEISTHEHVSAAFTKPILNFFISKVFFKDVVLEKTYQSITLVSETLIKTFNGESFKIGLQILVHLHDLGSVCGKKKTSKNTKI